VNLPVKPVLRIVAFAGSFFIALATGAAMAAQWPAFALFWYAPSSASGTLDPIFGRPLNFYLFTLPAWNLLAGWLLTLAVVTCILAVLFFLISGGARAFEQRRFSADGLPWRGLCFPLAFLLLVSAIRVYLGRFDQLFDHHTVFDGVTYTGAHVTLTGMLLVSAALVLGAVIAAVSGVLAPRARWLAAAVTPAVICYAGVDRLQFAIERGVGADVRTARRRSEDAVLRRGEIVERSRG